MQITTTKLKSLVYLGLGWLIFAGNVNAEDWLRFRGPNGAGISNGEAKIPVEFSSTKNLLWKTQLLGPGSSSPIVVGDRVFLTCWTGYGTGSDNAAVENQKNLKRHLLCIDRNSGKVIWNQAVSAVLPEDRYGGMFAENGYATHTPVSDGERVYVFYGKSGVYAYDLSGKELWKAKVGSGLDRRGWGSSSSPIIYGDKLIVTAVPESQKIFAFDKKTGKELWSTPSEMLEGTWGTPLIAETKGGRQDLVLAVPYEVWGLNPENGKLRWYGESYESSSMCASAIEHEGTVFVIGGRNGGAAAIRAAGQKGSQAARKWSSNERARIGTPIYFENNLYWIYGGIAKCINAETGDRVYQERLSGPKNSSSSNSGQSRRRGRGGSDYSSPVVANGNMFFVTRGGVVYVVKLGAEFKQLAANVLSDGGDFSATPAISGGQMFIRSSKNLYCIGAK